MKKNKHHCVIGGIGKDCRKEMFLSICSSLSLKTDMLFLYYGEKPQRAYSFLKIRYIDKSTYYDKEETLPGKINGLVFKVCSSEFERDNIISKFLRDGLQMPFDKEVLLCINNTNTNKTKVLELSSDETDMLLNHNMRYIIEHTGLIKEINMSEKRNVVVSLFDCY